MMTVIKYIVKEHEKMNILDVRGGTELRAIEAVFNIMSVLLRPGRKI